ncbi:MAG TPA: ABC transporter permease, partial [Puia sp.]
MFKNYLITAWRNLVKNKTHSFINIAGLSVGLVCSLLILLWVQNELSIDDFNKKNARIYKIYEREYYRDHIDGNYDTPGLLGDELKNKIPEIEDVVMMEEENDLSTLQAGSKILKVSGMGAGASLFKVFSYPLLRGMPNDALASISDIAISEKTAIMFFGSTQNAMSKTIRFNNKRDFIVSAVFQNPPVNASRKFDYVISWGTWLED